MGTFLALLLTAAALPAPAPVPAPAGLMKLLAAQAARLQQGLQKLSIEVTADYRELDRSGQPTHEGVSTARIDFDGPSRQTRVLRATLDGKDNLEKAQAEASENDRKERKVEGPFEAWNQPKYRFEVLGPAAEPGLWRMAIEPLSRASGVLEGEALVDPVSGEAVRVAVHPSKLPVFVDRLDFVVDYATRLPGVGRTLSHISIDGEGGFLFFRKHRKIEIAIRYLSVGGKPVTALP
ncbi:MAG: hypothetical protein ACYDCL_16590 [Myxococcales bacterium]